MLYCSDDFHHLLAGFATLSQPTFSAAAVKHGVEHHIATTGPPVHARAWHLDPTKLAVSKTEFSNMERLGIVHQSPLQIIPKTGWRLVHMWLNDAITPDRYPFLNIQDFNELETTSFRYHP